MFTGFHLQVLKTQYLFVSSGIRCCYNFSPQIRLEILVHGLCSCVVVLYRSDPCLPTKRKDPVCEDCLLRQGIFPWPFAWQASSVNH